MAGINRIYAKWHSDKVDLVYWVIKNKPSYLHNLIVPFDSYDEVKCYGEGKVPEIVGSKIKITIAPESAIAIIKKARED